MNTTTPKTRFEPSTNAKRSRILTAVAQDRPRDLAVFRRAFSGTSKANGIKAKCLECVWLDHAAIAECTATECPLHPYRPFQKKGET